MNHPGLVISSARIVSAEYPVAGVTLEPYVVVRRSDNTSCNAEDCPEEGAGDARFSIRFRWYRSVVHRGGAVCYFHQDREATIQCTLCLRCKVDSRRSFACSTDCLKQHWGKHKEFHSLGAHTRIENGYLGNNLLDHGNNLHNHKGLPSTYSNGGETWIQVGKARCYTPTVDDISCMLKCEVVAVDSATTFAEHGKTFTMQTARVRQAPLPPQRAMYSLVQGRQIPQTGTFTALTYNLLADLYATPEQFSYCQPYMLAWGYRKQNLLRELLNYKADIMCLQEVQSNHFTEFLSPELQKAGYSAIYKKKTTEMYTGNAYAIDGCATFFRRDRFALVKKYEVEFNKAALSLSEALPAEQRQAALNRLLKDNVALIAVLEALPPVSGLVLEGDKATPLREDGKPGPKRQLICVANTHIHANPELNDVKLWQVHTLLKGLEKIAASGDIPMLLAGDFNSTPGSAAHSLLVNHRVEPGHPELANDPLNILRPPGKLQHALPLSSAYAAVAKSTGADPKQRRRVDASYHEPKFTNASKDFRGTLDYVLYTADSLTPMGVLELPDESEVVKGPRGSPPAAGLPSEHWSSDHIALMAAFQYKSAAGQS